LDYIKERKQLIVLRTFSKVYGLAGLRIGYALGREDLVDCLYQVRDPFPVHRLAQVAAVAALNDEDHAIRSIQLVYEGKDISARSWIGWGSFMFPAKPTLSSSILKRIQERFLGLLERRHHHSTWKGVGLSYFCKGDDWKDRRQPQIHQSPEKNC